MSDTEATTEAAADAEAPEPAAEPDQPEAVEQTTDDTNAEAAKYRRRLREAEGQLKTVTEQLNAVQTQQVESLLADLGLKPQALWTVAELADLLADDGSIDTDKVTKAVATAREKLGIPPAPKGNLVPGVGNQPSGTPKLDTWKQAFSPAGKKSR